MLKTYRIIPLIFILFLFGFTLITVAPVIAWEKSMGMRHSDRPCVIRNICRDDTRSSAEKANDPYDTNKTASQAARALQDQSSNFMLPVAPSDPSGGQVTQLNARITELEAENARLLEQKGATANK